MATELIRGKTRDEALVLSASDLSAPLGPLPPMKIHCGQMVEGALKAALDAEQGAAFPTPTPTTGHTLVESFAEHGLKVGKVKIVMQ
jgi:nitrogen fixation protein NifU and related proteins